MNGKLILARHHESEWNKLGKWTGLRDCNLSEYGFKKSGEMGLLIKDIPVSRAFASMLVRSIETLSCMLTTAERYDVQIEHAAALNERSYGDYTGKNKFEMEKILGKAEWNKVRRDWDEPVPNGETLKMVYARVIPYFLEKILPCVKEGNNTLVVAHGNSLRALTKYIENISDEAIARVEMLFGAVVIYDIDEQGHMISKETRQVASSVPA